MKNDLFIPKKLKVGFTSRQDTYSKKLAFVAYYDNNGKLAREGYFNNWIEKDLGIEEYGNEPMEGFVLNRAAGGVRESWGWNTRREYVRVYDPRGFEIEITIPNLLYVLEHRSSFAGKGLEGQFIYAWDKQTIFLMPVGTPEHAACLEFSKLQGKKVSSKSLVEGVTYLDNKGNKLVYLGKHNFYFPIATFEESTVYPKADGKGYRKKFIFWDIKKKCLSHHLSANFISSVHDESCHSNYAEFLAMWENNIHASRAVKLFTKKKTKFAFWAVEDSEGVYTEYHDEKRYDGKYYIFRHKSVAIKNGILRCVGTYGSCSKENADWYNDISWVDPTNVELWVELENGNKFPLRDYNERFYS